MQRINKRFCMCTTMSTWLPSRGSFVKIKICFIKNRLKLCFDSFGVKIHVFCKCFIWMYACVRAFIIFFSQCWPTIHLIVSISFLVRFRFMFIFQFW